MRRRYVPLLVYRSAHLPAVALQAYHVFGCPESKVPSRTAVSCAGKGEHVASSPRRVHIVSNAPSPRHCTVSGPGRSVAVAGQRADFCATLRDAFGNTCNAWKEEEEEDAGPSSGHSGGAESANNQRVRHRDAAVGPFATAIEIEVSPCLLCTHIPSAMGSPYQSLQHCTSPFQRKETVST